MSFFVNFIMSVLDVGKSFRHVFSCKFKQHVGYGVASVCVLEILNQEIPADDGFCLWGKIGHNICLVLVGQIGRMFSLYANGGKVFLSQRWKQEEINHLFFVSPELGFGHIHFQNLFFGIFHGLFPGNLLVSLVLLVQFFNRGKLFLSCLLSTDGIHHGILHITFDNVFVPNPCEERYFAYFCPAYKFLALFHIIVHILLILNLSFLIFVFRIIFSGFRLFGKCRVVFVSALQCHNLIAHFLEAINRIRIIAICVMA